MSPIWPTFSVRWSSRVLTLLCWALATFSGLPLLMLSVECIMGALPARQRPHAPPPPFAVLIPAHDEASGIAAVLDAVVAQLRPCDRVLVVADNCHDDTAALARACGAEVVERRDPERCGKAYALSYGRTALGLKSTSVVIIVDADCYPQPGALARLAAHADQQDRKSVV